MKFEIVAVYDNAVQAYGRPVFTAAKGVAIRSFTDEVNNPQSEMNKHPGDYSLYYLGSYNEEDGSFDTVYPPEMLVPATHVFTKGVQ